LDVTIIWA